MAFRHRWEGDGPLGLKLKPKSGDMSGKQGVIVSSVTDESLPHRDLVDTVIHQVMHDDYHAYGLQEESYEMVIEAISAAGR